MQTQSSAPLRTADVRQAPKTTNTIYSLLLKLNSHGGSIVSANACTADELVTARQFQHVWSDGEGMTFVYLPASGRSAVGFGSGLQKAVRA